jgi:hypothetical protein
VSWQGPNNQNDYVAIVLAGAREGSYLFYAYTSRGNPATVRAPIDAGAHEIRYVTAQGRTLASVPITVTAATASVEPPANVAPGADFVVAWQGPNNQNDYIAVAAVGAREGAYLSYVYTSRGQPGPAPGADRRRSVRDPLRDRSGEPDAGERDDRRSLIRPNDPVAPRASDAVRVGGPSFARRVRACPSERCGGPLQPRRSRPPGPVRRDVRHAGHQLQQVAVRIAEEREPHPARGVHRLDGEGDARRLQPRRDRVDLLRLQGEVLEAADGVGDADRSLGRRAAEREQLQVRLPGRR